MNIDLLPNKNKDWFKRLIELRKETNEIFYALDNKKTLLQYASNKWTLKELLDHLTECEKIFNYRALRFSKNENIELPGFDENLFVLNGNANEQPLALLLEEFDLTRFSSLYFFGKLTDEELKRKGTANTQEYSIECIAEHIAKHNEHHLKIIKERYLPLL